jgi:hypothetical protein
VRDSPAIKSTRERESETISIVPSDLLSLLKLFTQIGNTRLKHSQNLNNTTSNNYKHKESNKTFAYGWIIGMFCRLPDGDVSTFVDVAIEFLLSVSNVSWCWLLF